MTTKGDVPAINHDMFRHGGGLGFYTKLILDHLTEVGPSTVADLSEALSVPQGTIRRKLKTLRQEQTVERNPDGTWTKKTVHPDTIAVGLGTHGKGKRQRERHARELADQRRAVEAWRKKQTADGQKTSASTAKKRPHDASALSIPSDTSLPTVRPSHDTGTKVRSSG